MSKETQNENALPAPFRYQDYQSYWDGLDNGKPVLQKCGDCGAWCHVPQPICPQCLSLNKTWEPISGKGTIYSWVVYRESPNPAFPAPYAVILVELEEGMRFVGNLVDVSPDDIEVGMPVQAFIEEIAEDHKRIGFKKA